MEETETKPDGVMEAMQEAIAKVQEEDKKRINVWRLQDKGYCIVNNADEANEIGAYLIRAEEELERVKACAMTQINRAKSRLDTIRRVFESGLFNWTQDQVSGKKRKSIVLENVMLGTRKVPSRVKTESQVTLDKWAEAFCIESVSYVTKVDINIVKDWEAKNKKEAPGRHREEEGVSFYFKKPKLKEGATDDE